MPFTTDMASSSLKLAPHSLTSNLCRIKEVRIFCPKYSLGFRPTTLQLCPDRPKCSLPKRKLRANRTGAFEMQSAGVASASIDVMVNDCSGKMGHAVAEAAVLAGLNLVPHGITGPGMGGVKVACGGVAVEVHGAEEREEVMDRVLQEYPKVIVVDYTLPAAVNENAEFYCRKGLPFVMGTTGGDREKLVETAVKSQTYAIIAPQMGKQVVAFQAAMEIMAENFPGAFSSYSLKVVESHQSSKIDTSGTAKAIVQSFQKLGLKFDVDQIELVRDPAQQLERMGVPDSYLAGHAFHTYRLVSSDNTVAFEFQHNVCGRSIYAQGTVDAVLFLAKQIEEKADKKVYNMIDVLRAGSMR